MRDYVIRKALPEEAEKIIDINIEVWHSTYKDIIPEDIINKLQEKNLERINRMKQNIIDNNNVYVAIIDNNIIGYSTYGPARDNNFNESGEIYAGYILDKYQQYGIGKKLAIKCMKDLYENGFRTLITKCLVGNPSNEFHKSIGGIYVGQSEYKPLNIDVGVENIYYHEDLERTIQDLKEKI